MPSLVNLDSHWKALSHIITLLRAVPDNDSRERLGRVLEALLPLFLRREPSSLWFASVTDFTCETLRALPLGEVESLFRTALWPVLIDEARRLARLDPDTYPAENEIESNWQNLKSLVGLRGRDTN